MKNTIKTAMALALITTTYAMDELDFDSFVPTVEVKKAESGPKPIGSIAVPSLAGGLKTGGLGKPAFKITPITTKPAGVLFDPHTHIAKADINSSHAEYRPAADVVAPTSYVLKTEIDESADGTGTEHYVLRTAKQKVENSLGLQGQELKVLKTTQAVQNKALELAVNHQAQLLAHVAQLIGIEMNDSILESEANYHTPTTADNYEARIEVLKTSGTWPDDIAEARKSLLAEFSMTVGDFESRAKATLQLDKAARTYGLVLDGTEDGDAMSNVNQIENFTRILFYLRYEYKPNN